MSFVILVGGQAEEGASTIALDVPTSVSTTFKRNVTKHPIEGGSTITDHSVKGNTIIRVEGVIAEFLTTTSKDSFNYTDRIPAIYDSLKGLLNSGDLVTVATGLDSYPTCVLTSAVFPKTKEHGNIQPFSLEFEQVRIISSDTVAVSETLADMAVSSVKLGNKFPKKVDENSEGADKSIWQGLKSTFSSAWRATTTTFE